MALLFLLGFSNVCLSSSNVIYTFCFACMFFIYVIYLGWVFEELTQAFSKYATEFHQIIRLSQSVRSPNKIYSQSPKITKPIPLIVTKPPLIQSDNRLI